MIKKLISVLALFVLLLSLCGCGCQHEWIAADCNSPKHCEKCGLTEGDAIDHQLSEASYWQAPVCAVCGAEYGEPLEPGFEKMGYDIIDVGEIPEFRMWTTGNGTIYVDGLPYRVSCNKACAEGTMYIRLKDFSIMERDSEHPPLDGYEWQTLELEFISVDENIKDYGYLISAYCGQYYGGFADDDSFEPDEPGVPCEIEWQGEVYDECLFFDRWGEPEWGNIQVEGAQCSNLIGVRVTYYFETRVPEGYDGWVLGWYKAANEVEDIERSLEKFDNDTVFIRMR